MSRPSIQDRIHVTNMLSNKIMIVHCRSKDDNLGGHAIAIGEEVSWHFDPDYFGLTTFWCDLAVEDKRLSFTAFNDDGDKPYIESWEVYDDGVYGNRSLPGERFMGAWRQIGTIN
ncbi:unnamed protein product [Linum trigynum]|uniref:S-protein homolog n=1 Tax=Linum trigynum TaxID=586398 RepID=A0AAV2CRR7_9ROSI